MTLVVHTRAELHAARTTLTAPLGMVATMGALHAGHRALLDAARSGNDGRNSKSRHRRISNCQNGSTAGPRRANPNNQAAWLTRLRPCDI